MNELDSIIGRKAIPCPHCGMKNAPDADTCFFCGQPMTAADGAAQETAEPELTDDEEYEAEYEPHHAAWEDEAPVPPERPRRRYGGLLLLGMVLLTAAVLAIVYYTSPAHEAIRLVTVRQYIEAEKLYVNEIRDQKRHETIFKRKMTAHLDDLEAYYRSDKLSLEQYAQRAAAILDFYTDTDVTDAVKTRFQNILDEQYDAFMNDTAGELYLSQIKKNYNTILNANLHKDGDIKLRLEAMELVRDSRSSYGLGVQCEESKQYAQAIGYYRQVIQLDKNYPAAQEALTRCADLYRAEALTGGGGDGTASSDAIAQRMNILRQALETLTDDPSLTAELTKQTQYYAAARKREALAMAQNMSDFADAMSEIRDALQYNPNDAELTAELDRLWTAGRKELMTNLRQNMALSPYRNPEILYQLLAYREDAELRSLLNRFNDYQLHGLSHFLAYFEGQGPTGVTCLYWPDASQDDVYRVAPVADAGGRWHDPFSLWEFTSTRAQTAVIHLNTWVNATGDLNRMSFTIDPAAHCGSGTARIEVWTSKAVYAEGGMTCIYTSPTLTRQSGTVKVNLPMNDAGFAEIRLVTDTAPDGKPMVMLLDQMWIESGSSHGQQP